MDLEQFEKASDIQKDIKYMNGFIKEYDNSSINYYTGDIHLIAFNDKEIVKAIITTLREQVRRLEAKFESIK